VSDLRKAAEMALNYFDNLQELNDAEYEIMKALRQSLAMERFSEISQEIEEDLKRRSGFMRKIVINVDYGGFGLSDEAMRMYLSKSGQIWEEESREPNMTFFWLDKANEKLFWENDLDRNDPLLIEVIETITCKKASGRFAKLKIVEIPENVEWHIEEHDGLEWVAEDHRTWR